MYYNKNFKCLECNYNIPQDVYNYSTNRYGVPLCMHHQKWVEHMSYETSVWTIKLYFALKMRSIPAELEKYDGYKHVDIAIPDAKIYIEVDGSQHNLNAHQALTDLKRTYHSLLDGYYTIRIPNSLTYNDMMLDETADYLADLLHQIMEYRHKNRLR